MKKINDVSKKIKDSTAKVESKVKEKIMPKIAGYETVILSVLVVMVVTGLVSGKGLMIFSGILTAIVVGLPLYSGKLEKIMPKKKETPKVEKKVIKTKEKPNETKSE